MAKKNDFNLDGKYKAEKQKEIEVEQKNIDKNQDLDDKTKKLLKKFLDMKQK